MSELQLSKLACCYHECGQKIRLVSQRPRHLLYMARKATGVSMCVSSSGPQVHGPKWMVYAHSGSVSQLNTDPGESMVL